MFIKMILSNIHFCCKIWMAKKLQKSPFSPSFRDLFALRIHNGQYYSCGSYFKLYILQFGHVSQ